MMSVDIEALRAEVEGLQQTLRDALKEKDRALRLMRRSNTGLDGRVRDQYQQLTTLNHLVTTVNASLDLHEVATTALVDLEMLVGVQAASIAWMDGVAGLRYLAARPANWWDALSQVRLNVGEGIIGRVVQTGQNYVTADATPDPLFLSGVDTPAGFHAQSILCEPLVVHDQVIGALLLANKWAGPFNDADRSFIETVAGSVAIAMENARMYEQVHAQLKELEKKNAQLLETQAQLIQSEKLASIGELTAGLTHEINNPIGIILGFAQLIGQHETDNRLRGYAELIVSETMRVKRVVDNLMGFARHSSLDLRRVDLRDVLLKVINLIEYQLTRDNIHLHYTPSDSPVWVLADENQILQVLMNLIQNARHAMPEGGDLSLHTQLDARMGSITVTDTGIGIAEANIGRIFDPFFTTKPVGQGTGLGLSVSYGIVKRHGGDILVTSQPGAGASFVVRLPLASD
jgi:signal transduction histidine kinase